MENIKIIAFDLDDTLLNSKKELTSETFETLKKASSMGIEIIPCTGRLCSAVPEVVKELDFVNYNITLNGADIRDVKNNKSIAKFEIPTEYVVTLSRVFKNLPVIYDCVADSIGYMSKECFDKIPDFMIGEWQVRLVRDFRTPVDDLGEFFDSNKLKGQKMQVYTLDKELRKNLLQSLPVLFPKNIFSSSIQNNIEINDLSANKGSALKFMAEYLGVKIEQTLAFGDGLNDIEMLKAAGIGVAMENACDELKSVADYVTSSCNENGVAEGIKKFCFDHRY